MAIYSVTKFPFCDSLSVNHSISVKIANHDFYSRIRNSFEANAENLNISVQFFVTCKLCISGTLVLEFLYKMKFLKSHKNDCSKELLKAVFLNSCSLISHLWYLKMCSAVYSVTQSAFSLELSVPGRHAAYAVVYLSTGCYSKNLDGHCFYQKTSLLIFKVTAVTIIFSLNMSGFCLWLYTGLSLVIA